MITGMRLAAAAALLCVTDMAASATPQPLENFARRPQMQDVTISGDGRYVAFLSGAGDETTLMTVDRTQPGSSFKSITSSESNKFDLGWCRWANESRLLCGLTGNLRGKKYAEPPFARIFAVNADGKALKTLEESRNEGNLLVQTTSARNFNWNYGASIQNSNQSNYANLGGQDHLSGALVARYMTAVANPRKDEVVDMTPDDPTTS